MSQSPFSHSGFRLAWDSTTLQAFAACPRRYYYAYHLGYQPRTTRVELAFGVLFHKALELWERGGRTGETAIIRAILSAPEADALRAEPDNSPRCLAHLIRAIVWYWEEYRHDNLQTVAAELSFRIGFGEALLCGHIDRVVTYQDRIWFVDYKTTRQTLSSAWFDNFQLSLQMDVYALGARVALESPAAGGIIQGVQLAVTFNRFARSFVEHTPDALEEAAGEIEHLISRAREHALADYWPRNKTACFMCAYKSVCSRQEPARSIWLENDFVRVNPWNPLENR